MEATTSIVISEIISLSQGLANTNLGYLGICVTIILFSGGITAGFYYYFNFKPLQESIKKQKSQLEFLEKEIDEKLEKINTQFNSIVSTQASDLKAVINGTISEMDYIKKAAFEKIEKAEKQLSAFKSSAEIELNNLREKYKDSELDSKWKEFWMWEGQGVHENSIVCLVEYMEMALEYKKIFLIDLWLIKVKETLENIKKYKSSDKQKTQSELLAVLNKIDGKDKEKEEIKVLIRKIFE